MFDVNLEKMQHILPEGTPNIFDNLEWLINCFRNINNFDRNGGSGIRSLNNFTHKTFLTQRNGNVNTNQSFTIQVLFALV